MIDGRGSFRTSLGSRPATRWSAFSYLILMGYMARGHLHPDNEERLFAGDPRLNGFSPENIDIMDVCAFVDLYFKGSPFPWIAR